MTQKPSSEKLRRILTIDLAQKCGWAVLELECPAHDGEHPYVLECGDVDFSAHTIKRWLNLEREINALFNKFKPELIIIETNFVFKNIRTTAALNQLRGSVLLLAALAGITVAYVDNNSAKKKILGTTRWWDESVNKYVGITKEMMHEAVKKALCSYSCVPFSHDAADAVALGITYYDSVVPVITLPRKPKV